MVITPKCRLHPIMAREAPRAVIFRRGPSRRCRLILWHTDRDEFECGQWFKGRIYHDRCDLSPDGRLLIYFAAKHTGELYSWTAISRPPYLTALALWKKGDCWDGGGLFENANSIWLNHPPETTTLHQGALPTEFEIRGNDTIQRGENEPIHGQRLDRERWDLTQGFTPQTYKEFATAGYSSTQPQIRIKRRASLALERRYYARNRKYLLDFTITLDGQSPIALPPCDWADFDQFDRLVFTSGGKIFSADLNRHGSLVTKELADFTDQRFEPIESPDWAKSW